MNWQLTTIHHTPKPLQIHTTINNTIQTHITPENLILFIANGHIIHTDTTQQHNLPTNQYPIKFHWTNNNTHHTLTTTAYTHHTQFQDTHTTIIIKAHTKPDNHTINQILNALQNPHTTLITILQALEQQKEQLKLTHHQ